MSTQSANDDFPESIIVVPGAKAFMQEQQESKGSTRLTSQEEWEMNKQAVKRYSKEGNWAEVLKILTVLSTKQKSNEVFQALGQRVWVALKSEADVTDVVRALFLLLSTFGVRHEIAPHIAAVAQLVANHRTPDHPDRGLAQGQAQQMFSLVCDEVGIEGREAFDRWVVDNRLDDADFVVAVVFRALDLMVGEAWWIDREALQKELDEANVGSTM